MTFPSCFGLTLTQLGSWRQTLGGKACMSMQAPVLSGRWGDRLTGKLERTGKVGCCFLLTGFSVLHFTWIWSTVFFYLYKSWPIYHHHKLMPPTAWCFLQLHCCSWSWLGFSDLLWAVTVWDGICSDTPTWKNGYHPHMTRVKAAKVKCDMA